MSGMSDDTISATLHEVAVNLGDHAETILRAHEVDEDETVRALLERLIPPAHKWRERKYEHFVTLRFVMPAATHDHEADVAAHGPEVEPF